MLTVMPAAFAADSASAHVLDINAWLKFICLELSIPLNFRLQFGIKSCFYFSIVNNDR